MSFSFGGPARSGAAVLRVALGPAPGIGGATLAFSGPRTAALVAASTHAPVIRTVLAAIAPTASAALSGRGAARAHPAATRAQARPSGRRRSRVSEMRLAIRRAAALLLVEPRRQARPRTHLRRSVRGMGEPASG